VIIPGNPLEEKHSTEGDWRDLATKRLTKLKKLDGEIKYHIFMNIEFTVI
jgi:dynein light chain 1